MILFVLTLGLNAIPRETSYIEVPQDVDIQTIEDFYLSLFPIDPLESMTYTDIIEPVRQLIGFIDFIRPEWKPAKGSFLAVISPDS